MNFTQPYFPSSLQVGVLVDMFGGGIDFSPNVQGSTPPVTFSISAGALPAGLSLASSGAVTGTPTTVGPFAFTVLATDSLANIASISLNGAVWSTALYGSPVQIDAGQDGDLTGGRNSGPFEAGGKLYVMLDRGYRNFNPNIFTSNLGIYQTADGATWTGPLDSAHAPQGMGVAIANQNPAVTGKITCLYIPNSGLVPFPPPDSGVLGPIEFMDFDLATLTWGAPYGSSIGVFNDVESVDAAWHRTDGAIVISYSTAEPPSSETYRDNRVALFSGVWNTPFNPDANLVALPGCNVATYPIVAAGDAILDAADRLHLFMQGGFPNVFFHQPVESDGTLGILFQLPIQRPEVGIPSGSYFGTPVIQGDRLLLPVARNVQFPAAGYHQPSIMVGTPLSNPVWTVGSTLDPFSGNPINDPPYPPSEVENFFLEPITGKLWQAFDRQDSTDTNRNYAQLRIGWTSNLANPDQGWNNVTAWDSTENTDPPLNGGEIHLPTPWANPNGALVLFSGIDPNTGNEFAFSLGAYAPYEPPPPPATHPPPHGGSGGSKQVPGYVTGTRRCIPNGYDLCLNQEVAITRYAQQRMARPTCFQRLKKWPYTAIPSQGRTINEIGAIPPPDPTAGFVPVFSYLIPLGYDLALNMLFQFFTGPLNQGSGDLIWQLRIGRVFAKNLGQTTVQLGSGENPYPIEGSLLGRSLNLVQYFVRNMNAATIPPGVGMIVCGIQGWIYPRK